MKTIILLAASAVGSLLFSLGFLNQDKKTSTASTKSEKIALLVNHKWQMTDEVTYANGSSVNTFKNYKPCVIDDMMTFYNNGNITLDENKEKCSASAPQKSNGIWAFNIKDATKLDVALTTDFTAEIVELTESKFVWKYQNAVGDVLTQTFTKL